MFFLVVGNRGIIGARETMAGTEHWPNAAEVPTRETQAHEEIKKSVVLEHDTCTICHNISYLNSNADDDKFGGRSRSSNNKAPLSAGTHKGRRLCVRREVLRVSLPCSQLGVEKRRGISFRGKGSVEMTRERRTNQSDACPDLCQSEDLSGKRTNKRVHHEGTFFLPHHFECS